MVNTTSIQLNIDPVFSRLMASQREFQRMLHGGQAPAEMSDVDKMAYILTQAYALIDEVGEATDETGWKPWATSNHINRDAYLGELADVYIFFMNLMLVADITTMELANAVAKKQVKNIKRQQDGYDGVSTKCYGCKRAYDDDAVKCFPGSDEGYAWCAKTGGFVDQNGDSLP